MSRSIAAWALCLQVALVPALVQAQGGEGRVGQALERTFAEGSANAKAQALLQEVDAAWDEAEPWQLLEKVWQAQDLPTDDGPLTARAYLFEAALLHVKIGILDEAEIAYSRAIRLARSDDPIGVRVKAEAMIRKGNLLYSSSLRQENADEARTLVRGAFQMFISSNANFRRSTTVDTASQLSLRMALDGTRGEKMQEKLLEQALKAAQEAIDNVDYEYAEREQEKPQALQRFKLQKALVLWHTDKQAAAEALVAELDPDGFDIQASYQRATWAALHEDYDAALQHLQALQKTRKASLARNNLRRFTASETAFQPALSRPDWQKFLVLEPDEVRRKHQRRLEQRKQDRERARMALARETGDPQPPREGPSLVPGPEDDLIDDEPVYEPEQAEVEPQRPIDPLPPGDEAEAEAPEPAVSWGALIGAICVIILLRLVLKAVQGPK